MTANRRPFLLALFALLLASGVIAALVRPSADADATEPPAAVPADALAATEPESEPEAGVEAELEGEAGAGDPAGAEPEASAGVAAPAVPYPVVDRSQRVARPEHVRGIYLNAWAAGSSRKFERLLGVARATEVNAFVIDVKEVGEISYPSAVPLAVAAGANRRYIPDIQRVLRRMREEGVYPIARIVVFRDEVLARARPDLAIQREDGTPWVDTHGHGWVDPYNRTVWDYNIALAREAIELGFSEIQWDYIRFPDVPAAVMRTGTFPARAGRARDDAIREFLLYAREQLAELGAPLTADVFGLTTSSRTDMGIGQLWEKMIDAVDAILPMMYPSHYAAGSYGIAQPNASPYRTIRAGLEDALRRSRGVPGAAVIRPWLQDFTLGQPRYGPEHVRAQIQAIYDAGLHEWILWNPGSNYTEAALAAADGTPPLLPLPDLERSLDAGLPEPAARR
jgi:hypothetical protein